MDTTDLIIRILKFGIVGISGIGVDFLITWLCKEKFAMNRFVANALGFTLAVFSNYSLNRLWTFEDKNPNISEQFMLFAAVSLTGLLFNTTILYLLNKKHRYNFYLSKVAAIGIVFIWNFIANSFITFPHA